MNGHLRAIPHFASRIARRPAPRFDLPCFLALLLIFAAGPVAQAADAPDLATLFRTGKYVECAEAAGKAIKANEAVEGHHLLKLRSELTLGRYSDAAGSLDLALKNYPGSIEARWWGREVCRFTNQPDRVKQLDAQFSQLVQQTPWRYSDAANRIIVGRFLLAQGLDPKQILDGAYNIVKKQQPTYVPAWIASGELALDKSDFALAAQAFQQAAKLDPTEPEAHFGLALAFAPSEPEKADAALKAALERNPNHLGCLLLTIDELIDSERYEDAETILLHVATINPHHPQAAAYRAVLAHLRNQPDRERSHREAGLKFWPTNPEVDHLIGKKLSQKYRFAKGSEHQRQALKFDPAYAPAKMQLASDLLRLGQEEEGWRLADEIYHADGYNVVAHNLVMLHESVSQFRSLEQDGIIARMDAREADIYGHRVLDLLTRAKRDLCAKYDVKLKGPIIVEMFPKQEDFAIRTFGLPGGAGFLGVCFGTVITANSPASQGANPTCWESTLWHEFCHVVTLNKTHNRMPRWLSEGISVYEEREANTTWGQDINPLYRKMLLGDDLTPVDKLSSAFLRPKSAHHLQFAYYESSLVVEFLVEKHGIETVKKILDDLGQGLTINDSLARHTGSLAELNQTFVAYARARAETMAPEADWSDPELPTRADAIQTKAWLKEHPKNYAGLQRLAKQLIVAKRWADAKEPLDQMLALYPRDAGDDSLYPMRAKVAKELKETAQERAAWERFAELSDDNVEMLTRLSELTSQAGEWEQTLKLTQRWLAINPLHPTPHRMAAEAAEQLKNAPVAVESYRALLLLNPVDVAELHLRLATVLQHSGDLPGAKRHALLALEEAPRFRAAHRRLLEIVKASGPSATDAPLIAPAPALPTNEDQP